MTQASSHEVEAPAPQPNLSGTFAMFDKPDGGIVFMIRFAGQDGERRWDVPPMLARRGRRQMARFLSEQ
jgi:hypothetical protein